MNITISSIETNCLKGTKERNCEITEVCTEVEANEDIDPVMLGLICSKPVGDCRKSDFAYENSDYWEIY